MYTDKSPREHIERLQQTREKNDPNSTSLANTLDNNIHTALKGENKFILELLQNADDAAEQGANAEVSRKETSVHILQIDEYLVFVHTGKPFSHDDVEKICDNAQDRFTDKNSDLNKTGYKGIGFKSIFSIASRVHIISARDYSFRFDENYYAQKNTVNGKYPWPIIPLWTDFNAIPPKVGLELEQLKLPASATLFILTLRQQEDVHQQVAFFKDDPSNIIFLRNISKISFSSKKNRWELSRHRINDQQIRIDVNGQPHSHWLLHHADFEIPAKIKDEMLKLKDVECPTRLKAAQTDKIIFAAEVTKENQLKRIRSGKFFCTLPTQVQCEIPAHINANFLLNAERTQLIENVWNKFLINKIAICMFEWMAQLAQSETYQSQILTLFPPSQLYYRNAWFSQAYQNSFATAKNSVAFLPEQYNRRRLLKLTDACHDSTEFYATFPELRSNDALVSPVLESINTIKDHIKRTLSIGDIIAVLPSYLSSHLDLIFQEKILLFLSQACLTFAQQKTLSNNIQLLDESMQLQSIGILYFRSDDMRVPLKVEARFVHADLHKNVKIKNFLAEKLNVKVFDALTFIRDQLVPMISDGTLAHSDYINVHAFLMHYHAHFNSSDIIWKELRKVPIHLSSEITTLADRCYLAHVYHPQFDAQNNLKLSRDIYVHDGYLQFNSDADKWRAYFLKLGVVEELTLRVLSRISSPHIKRLLPSLGELYIEYLITTYKIESENFMIEYFPYMEFLDCIEELNYATQYFWPNMLKMFNHLINNPSYLLINNQRIKILSIIQYIFTMHTIARTESNELLKSGELFAETIEEGFKPFLKIAKLPVKIDSAMAKYLGFNTEVNLTDCLNILTQLGAQESIDIAAYELILKRILTLASTGGNIEDKKQQIKRWNGRLPAYNGTLQDITALFCFSLTSVAINPSIYWLMHFKNIKQPELLQIAKLFSIEIITNEKISIIPTNPKNGTEIKRIIFERCHYLAVIMAKENEHKNIPDANVLLNQYQSAIAKIDFVTADELSLKHKNRQEICLQKLFCFQDANVLYIDNTFGISSRTLAYISDFVAELLSVTGKAYDLLSAIIELPQDKLTLLLNKEGYDQPVLDRHLKNTGTLHTISQLTAASANKPSEMTNNNVPQIDQQQSSNSVLQAAQNHRLQDQEEDEWEDDRNNNALDKALSSEIQSMGLNPPNENRQARFIPNASVEDCLRTGVTWDKELPNPQGLITTTYQPNLPPATLGHVPVNLNRKNDASQSEPKTNDRNRYESQDLIEIGFWAEHLVFLLLHAHYVEKYPQATIQKTHDGFMFEAQNKRLGLITYRLIWHNKQKESYAREGHRDFTLLKGKEERPIEVKGTICDKNQGAIATISTNEWQEMLRYQRHYYLYRVFNVGKSNACYSKIKNPAEAVLRNQLLIEEVKLKW